MDTVAKRATNSVRPPSASVRRIVLGSFHVVQHLLRSCRAVATDCDFSRPPTDRSRVVTTMGDDDFSKRGDHRPLDQRFWLWGLERESRSSFKFTSWHQMGPTCSHQAMRTAGIFSLHTVYHLVSPFFHLTLASGRRGVGFLIFPFLLVARERF